MAWVTVSRVSKAVGMAVFAGSLAASVAPAAAQTAEAAEAGPFGGFAGTWTGSGTIQRSSGETERLRCEARYEVRDGGNAIRQSLRCSSDSYNFDLRSNVEYDAGAVTGSWADTGRGLEGKITGRGQQGEIRAAVQSPQFSASILIQTRGNRQTVSIRSPGTELTNVSITMGRKG